MPQRGKKQEAFPVREAKREKAKQAVRIGIAKDAAFCFYYEDNLRLLEEYGAEFIPFSPLSDEKLPEGIAGLILGGGYPELFAADLEKNAAMRKAVQNAVEKKMPVICGCGGFMYLHSALVDENGVSHAMCGVLPKECVYKGKLVAVRLCGSPGKTAAFSKRGHAYPRS